MLLALYYDRLVEFETRSLKRRAPACQTYASLVGECAGDQRGGGSRTKQLRLSRRHNPE